MQRRTEPEQRARNLSEWFPYLPLPQLPAIFGLDSAGVGAAVGSHVTDVAVGDRVYVNPGISCGGCNACRQGHDQQQQVTIDYINRYKSEYGVEPI